MSFRSMLFLPAALCAAALSGCGGSGSSTPAPLPVTGGSITLSDPTSTDPSTLQAYGIDPTTQSTNSQRGTLDRSTTPATVDLGSLSGTVTSTDANGTYVTLDVGGNLAILYGKGGEKYVAFYSAQPTNGDDPTLGVVGVPSDATQLPTSKSASYTGEAQVFIVDGSTASYTLTGTSSSTVDFGAKTVSTTLTSLNGDKTDTSGKTSVSNVVDVTIQNAKLVNDTFSGGKASISSSTLSTNSLSGSQTVTQSGNLYGPAGAEIGGVFIIDDTAASNPLLLEGDFIGKQ